MEPRAVSKGQPQLRGRIHPQRYLRPDCRCRQSAHRRVTARAARLIGLQYYPQMAEQVSAVDGGESRGGVSMQHNGGYGDACAQERLADGTIVVNQTGLSIVRNLEGADRHTMLVVWVELWRGAIHSHRAFIDVQCDIAAECLRWTLSDSRSATALGVLTARTAGCQVV